MHWRLLQNPPSTTLRLLLRAPILAARDGLRRRQIHFPVGLRPQCRDAGGVRGRQTRPVRAPRRRDQPAPLSSDFQEPRGDERLRGDDAAVPHRYFLGIDDFDALHHSPLLWMASRCLQ